MYFVTYEPDVDGLSGEWPSVPRTRQSESALRKGAPDR
jgi:hypothetical protein